MSTGVVILGHGSALLRGLLADRLREEFDVRDMPEGGGLEPTDLPNATAYLLVGDSHDQAEHWSSVSAIPVVLVSADGNRAWRYRSGRCDSMLPDVSLEGLRRLIRGG